jgi:hypothetical protein
MIYLPLGWIVVFILLTFPFAQRATTPAIYTTMGRQRSGPPLTLGWTSGFV